jgi:hypothetical protein
MVYYIFLFTVLFLYLVDIYFAFIYFNYYSRLFLIQILDGILVFSQRFYLIEYLFPIELLMLFSITDFEFYYVFGSKIELLILVFYSNVFICLLEFCLQIVYLIFIIATWFYWIEQFIFNYQLFIDFNLNMP